MNDLDLSLKFNNLRELYMLVITFRKSPSVKFAFSEVFNSIEAIYLSALRLRLKFLTLPVDRLGEELA